MHLYFDESGDFAFPADRFDVYVQAALICPDSVLETVEQFVAGMKRELGVPELHAAELADEQLVEICRFVGAGPLSLVGQVTDTTVMTGEQISAHRKEQAALLADNLEQYKQADGKWAGAEAWYQRHIKRTELASRVNNSEYVQADLLVLLIHAALFKSDRPLPRRPLARRPSRLPLHPRRQAAGQAGRRREGLERAADAAPRQQPLRVGRSDRVECRAAAPVRDPVQ
jgi:hypothetical protein